MVAFYNAKDQAIYDAGDKFVPQTKYLQNDYVPTKGISYAGDGSPVSYANSGIMTQAPIIYPPIIDSGGDGGGDGPPTGPAIDNSQFDYEYDALGALDNPNNVGLTEEEQEALNASIAGPQLSKLGTLGTIGAFFASPLTTIGYLHRRDKKEQKRLEEKTRQAGIRADFDRAVAQGDSFYDDLNEGRGASVSKESRENAGPGFNDVTESGSHADGGRVGYFFGGRVNYKTGGRVSFKNRGLASIL